MSNVIRLWLALIGTSERAELLLDQLWRLDGVRHKHCGGEVKNRICQSCRKPLPRALLYVEQVPPGPEVVLFGAEVSRKLYSFPQLRPAFDAWDTRQITKQDIRRLAEWVAEGNYTGPVIDHELWLGYVYRCDVCGGMMHGVRVGIDDGSGQHFAHAACVETAQPGHKVAPAAKEKAMAA